MVSNGLRGHEGFSHLCTSENTSFPTMYSSASSKAKFFEVLWSTRISGMTSWAFWSSSLSCVTIISICWASCRNSLLLFFRLVCLPMFQNIKNFVFDAWDDKEAAFRTQQRRLNSQRAKYGKKGGKKNSTWKESYFFKKNFLKNCLTKVWIFAQKIGIKSI